MKPVPERSSLLGVDLRRVVVDDDDEEAEGEGDKGEDMVDPSNGKQMICS